MAQILPDNEIKEFEDRTYINPQLTVDETSSFIDNLRQTQQQNNAEIAQQTQALGTNVPSNLGGLTGAGSYWTSRYQTPQTNSVVADLRATAQAKALNDVLSGEQAAWKHRYNKAYQAYQKRQNDKQNTPSTTTKGGVDKNNNQNAVNKGISITANGGETVVPETDSETGNPTGWVNIWYADGSHERVYQGLEYSHDVGRAAGADQISDVFTGMYNYTLDDGRELELGGWDENLVKGSDGAYYIWNKSSNTYTPVNGNSGSTSGGTKWWKK